ncbi:hypothetical protein [Nonomuraea sp. LPB2021202275-12-8]|uniref:hypothetical protein n=1 Tax=Nonomuraea sp. LPB2021202275-12-8 TaxID=3120159 RepID=UPI00300CDE7E
MSGTRRRAVGLLVLLALAAALASVLFSGYALAASPTPTPSATPSQAPSPAPPPSAVEQECGFINVACEARQAVNEWFTHLVETASKPVFEMLGSTVLATPELDSPVMARAKQLWEVSRTIANTCFVLLVTAAGVMLMVGQALPGESSARELLPRLVWALLAANLSLVAIGYAITLVNGLSQAFLADGASQIDPESVFEAVKVTILAGIATHGVFFALVSLVAVILAVGVVFTYLVRLALTMVVIAAAPLALIFHALPMTDGLARLWWRSFIGLLAIQICQSLVLVTALKLLFSDNPAENAATFWIPASADLADLLMAVCLLFVLLKIPGWVAQTIWQANKPRTLSRLVQSLIVYRGLGMLLGKRAGAARTARRPKPPTPPNGGGGNGPGGPPGGGPPSGGPPGGGPGGPGPRPGGPRRPRPPSGTPTKGCGGNGNAPAGRAHHGRLARPDGPDRTVRERLDPIAHRRPQPGRHDRPTVRPNQQPNATRLPQSPASRRAKRGKPQVTVQLDVPRTHRKAERRATRK